jgi:peptidoglycan/LPS O-acetylase OafA/YrhL
VLATASSPPVTGWDAGYRPHLDGLRAVAVYLVVLFHAGSTRFSGGFIGVDVFFVLSGYLVTQLLLRDLSAVGSIGYARFYSRRFRRLLPAAFATLVVTAMVYTTIASPIDVLSAVGGFKAAFLYVTNWYFISQSAGYFGANLSSNPVLHFWSLAVEEQFYLLWPLLLGGLYMSVRRLGSRQWTVLRLIVAAGALSSLIWAWYLRDTNPNRAYYGTDARAYQLLAGALLALTPSLLALLGRSRVIARWMAATGLVGLVLLAAWGPSIDAIQRGTLATLLAVTLIAGMEAASGGPVRRVLSTEPLVYLGKISYGTYLWHWPVIVVLTIVFQPTTVSTIAITIVVATAMASLSFQVLERPIRLSTVLDRHRRLVIAAGLSTSIIAATILIPAITRRGTSAAVESGASLAAGGYTPVPAENWQALKHDQPQLPNCLGRPVEDCVLVHGTGLHILVIGDSHAGAILPAFRELADREHMTLSASIQGRCPWQRNLALVPYEVAGDPNWSEDCTKVKEDLYNRVLPELHPDIVVAMNQGYDQPDSPQMYLIPGHEHAERGSTNYNAWLEQATRSAVSELRQNGRKVVIIEPIPFKVNFDPLACLATATVIEQCRYIVSAQPTGLEKLYRSLHKTDDHVWSVDLDRAVCPMLPICDPIVNHEIVKLDATHLTSGFSRSLAPLLTLWLKQNGVIPR